MGAPARRLPLVAGAAIAGRGTFRGFTVRETAAAAATVVVHDGASATGAILAAITLPASGSQTVLDPEGVWFTDGVFVEVVSGTVAGSIFVG